MRDSKVGNLITNNYIQLGCEYISHKIVPIKMMVVVYTW